MHTQPDPKDPLTTSDPVKETLAPQPPAKAPLPEPGKEFGGQKGPEPTRYGDWEKNGRCTDF